MGAWQGVVMDVSKFHLGPLCPSLLRPAGEPPLKRLYGHFRRGLSAGQTAVFYPLEHPTPYSYANRKSEKCPRPIVFN
jgi:hypothetical protein